MVKPRFHSAGGSFDRLPGQVRAVGPIARIDLVLWAVALTIAPMSAQAQTLPPVVTVEGNVTATDNGALSASGQERSDLITSVRPKLAVRRRGAGFEFDLEAAATFLAYANGTQRGGVLPELRASLKSSVVERLLFVEAAAEVRQSEADPFGARAGDTTGANRRTGSTYRLSPYVEREFAPNTSFLARHDAVLTTNGSGAGSQLMSNLSLIRVERKPVPIGVAAELSRLENESNGSANSRFTLDTARLRSSVAIDGQIVLGAVAGSDRSKYLLSDHTDSLYGLTVQWKPSPRTEVSADVEHRFFGQAGSLSIQHRMPFMAFALSLSRQPVTSYGSLGVLGQGSDSRGFLDAILTTRYPDPAVRAGLVDSLVTSSGLEARTPNPIDVVVDYPQLQTAVKATWVLLRARNTASVTLYAQTTRQLTRDGEPLSFMAGAVADNRQRGGAFQFKRRLTPQFSAEAAARWSKITGLAVAAGDLSEQRSYRLSLMQSLSPRTGVSAGLQHYRFTTTATRQHSYDATLVFVGMSHRF